MADSTVFLSLLNSVTAAGARLVAVSKTRTEEEIMALHRNGQRLFGENRVEELVRKAGSLPDEIEWHMIGHLQTKKVKQVLPVVSMIHSGDSPRLLLEIEKRAALLGKTVNVLLQFKIAEEETKYGMQLEEARKFLGSQEWEATSHVRLCGVMGMATYTTDREQIRREFRHLKRIFDQLQSEFFRDRPEFCERSMGMSGDYQIALQEGSTLVRVGSLLFK